MRPLLHLGPNVITDRIFITLGFEMLLQMVFLLCLGPNVITDTTFITLWSSYCTVCAFYQAKRALQISDTKITILPLMFNLFKNSSKFQ